MALTPSPALPISGTSTQKGSTLFGGSGNDTINAASDIADQTNATLTGGDGVDTFNLLGNDAAALTIAAATKPAAGDKIVGGDVITDFQAGIGGDILKVSEAAAFAGVAALDGTALTASRIYAISGTYTASTNTFTFATQANGGFDTAIVVVDSSKNIDLADETLAILTGVTASSINAANIVVA